MSRSSPPGGGGRRGFTLIEVVAALVIFASGVLMAVRLAGTLALQMENSSIRSEVVSRAQEKVEQMERLDYEAFTRGTSVDTMTIRGIGYRRTTVVSDFGPRTVSLEVTVAPEDGGSGPSHTLLSYAYDPW